MFGCRVEEADIDKFVQAGLELLFELPIIVVATEPDMLTGERSQVKFQVPTAVEAFIEETVRLSCTWGLELEISVQIDAFKVVGLERREDDAVPSDGGEKVPTVIGTPLKIDGFKDAEGFAIPSLVISVPPRFFVVERDRDPAMDRLIDTAIGFSAIVPSQ